MIGLTTRQQEVLEFIVGFIREHEMAPTLREVGVALGIRSTNGVADHFRALERKGWIARSSINKSRSLILTPVAKEKYDLPTATTHQERRALYKIVNFVKIFPKIRKEVLAGCECPLVAAAHVIGRIEDILEEEGL